MGVIRFNFLSKELGMQTNVSICIPTFSFADMYNNRTEVYIPGMKDVYKRQVRNRSSEDGAWRDRLRRSF